MTSPEPPCESTGSIAIEALTELALDLRWSWNHGADELWTELEPDLWAETRNPWVVLQTVSRSKLRGLLQKPEYRARVETLLERKREYGASPAWFQSIDGKEALRAVAYFSMEYGLSEALPIYSGGLGNVAGDQLKAASDLGVPVVAVGLLYQQGYFRQEIAADGSQEALYPYNEPGQLPVRPVRDASGEWLRVPLRLPGHEIRLRAWQVQVGRLILYLLDSNDPANPPALRGITSELYGGGPELRLRQEMVLGIGGWRLLRALGLEPEVCHLNEGHAAFAVLERARTFMQDRGRPFEVALTVTRAGNLFTTHTPVAAGFDRFSPALVDQYLRDYAESDLGIGLFDLLALGRERPNDSGEPLNMAYLAIRGSAAVNGVSRLHGAVSRRLFQNLFPRWPRMEVPVKHVTNGVHVPTWDSPEADALWTKTCGAGRWRGTMEMVEHDCRCASDAELWALRTANRRALLEHARERVGRALASRAATADEVTVVRESFKEDTLTLGFARRFAAYKRPNLLLQDPGRLMRILNDRERPVQLIVAGKAHPADGAGQAMIREWIRFLRQPDARRRVLFLPDYDLSLAERLVQGVDVWINTPRRPWEACGTSGMKVLVNGGLNLSELDGWWAEAYAADVGWALGDGREHDEDPTWDAAEADALYTVLEREVVPAFYERGEGGMPTAWIAKIRESMARLTPRFSANRAVREYTERYYLPAAAAYRMRAKNEGAVGAKIAAWRSAVARHWHEVRFGAFHVKTGDGVHQFIAEIDLGGLDPEAVSVELFAEPVGGEEPVRVPMARERRLEARPNVHSYRAGVPASRSAGDYTLRLVPYHPDVAVPLEASEILWQR
jgi:glycogen phosphorylase